MFDESGRLLCEPNLATAQALCLLHCYEGLAGLTVVTSWKDISRYFGVFLYHLRGFAINLNSSHVL
jgi:hypothetical protein